MKNLLMIMLTAITMNAFGQSDTIQKKSEWQITILPSQLLLKELIVSVHKKTDKRISFEYSIGGIIAGKKVPFPIAGSGMAGTDYSLRHYTRPYYNAIYLSWAPRMNFDKGMFLSGEVFTRYWWTRETHIKYSNVEVDEDIDVIRDEDIKVIGLKLLMGATGKLFKISRQTRFIVSCHWGLGGRFKLYQYKHYSGQINNVDVSNTTEKFTGFLPSIHFGIKLGLSFLNQR